jgi:DNA-binding transcriptional MerR regulator
MATEKPSDSRRPPADGLTRSQVARQLGVGVTAVHYMRLRGELRPKRDASGVWRYDPADVIRAAATRGVRNLRTAGDVAAEAFRMFDQGGELKDIVSALRITPAEVRRLYKDWQSQLDDPPPAPESSGPGLLDEDPRAEETFLRAMAQAAGVAFPPTHKPKK